MARDEEILDVLDEDGQPVSTAPRSRVHEERLYHLAVHVLLVDEDQHVLLQRRSSSKRTYPGRWTSSVSGHVPAGERPGEAARRECMEEVGVLPRYIAQVTSFVHEDPAVGEHELCLLYAGVLDREPTPDGEEVDELAWRTPTAVDAWLEEAPKAFAPSFHQAWELGRPAVVLALQGGGGGLLGGR